MHTTSQRARITAPVAYRAATGRQQHIPVGPCLLERNGDEAVDIIWGATGQRCAALPVAAVEQAQEHGHLVLLD